MRDEDLKSNKNAKMFAFFAGSVGNYFDNMIVTSQEKAQAARMASSVDFVDYNLKQDIKDLESSERVATGRMLAFNAAHNVDFGGSAIAQYRSQIKEFEYTKIMTKINADLQKIEIEYQNNMNDIALKASSRQSRAQLISDVGSAFLIASSAKTGTKAGTGSNTGV